MKYLALLVLLVLVACGASAEAQVLSPEDPPFTDIGNGVARFIDDEAGVVCWMFYSKGTLSCLPLSETKLDK